MVKYTTGMSSLSGAMLPCRRLPFFYGPAAEMLAGAEALLEGATASGRATIRWYVTSDRAMILGASQKITALDAEACRARGVTVLQRGAGGASVLADADMLGLDIALPRDHPLLLSDLTASYRWIGEAWLWALRGLGVDAALVGVEEARAAARDESPSARLARLACFGGLSPYEVAVCGRKVVGLAQVRRRHGALFQIGVQLRWDAPLVAALLSIDDAERPALVAALDDRVAGLHKVAPRPIACGELVDAFEGAIAAHGLALADGVWADGERATVIRLLESRYRPLL